MAFDAFLKIDGITGENHSPAGSISIESFSWGLTVPRDQSPGAGVGKVVFTDLNIVKLVNSTSPKLFAIAVEGKHLPAVQLTCRKAGGQEVATYTLEGVLIGLLRDGGNRHGGEFPTEEISFNFNKIEFNVTRGTN